MPVGGEGWRRGQVGGFYVGVCEVGEGDKGGRVGKLMEGRGGVSEAHSFIPCFVSVIFSVYDCWLPSLSSSPSPSHPASPSPLPSPESSPTLPPISSTAAPLSLALSLQSTCSPAKMVKPSVPR